MSFSQCLQTAAKRTATYSLAILLLSCGLSALAAKPPVPGVRLPLKPLGFPGYTVAMMRAGASMATVHLLDSSHLLFTYSLRTLVPRLAGDDENDSDRLVAGVIVEIPSGKILARTEWHLHDHGRYLWSVGHGVFILRSGDDLSTFAPLHGLASGTAFERTALPHRPGHPELVAGSPDGEIVMLEIQRKSDETGDTDSEGDQRKHKHTVVEFYRVVSPKSPADPIEIKSAGIVGSPGLLHLALDGDGYLWAEDTRHNRWSISFDEYEGKGQDLVEINSSCGPRMELLSRSEFLVMACGLGDQAQTLSAYGFDGHENWREPFGETLQPPTFVAAPAGGRFAMSRLTASGSGAPVGGLMTDDATLNQEVRVYGTESGDLLLNVLCTPVVRSPENFDLSADGKMLAVLGRDSIDLYTLPALTPRDRKDLAEVQAMVPPESHGPVVLRRITRPVVAEQPVSSEETTAPQQPLPSAADAAVVGAGGPLPAAGSGSDVSRTKPAAAVQAPVPATRTATGPVNGDAVGNAGDGPRKPPTLLSPGESPEFKGSNGGPQ